MSKLNLKKQICSPALTSSFIVLQTKWFANCQRMLTILHEQPLTTDLCRGVPYPGCPRFSDCLQAHSRPGTYRVWFM